VYPTWDQMTLTTGITEKTLRKWVGTVVDYISEVDDLVRTTEIDLLVNNGDTHKNS
jgi:hypothetical protein